MLNDDILSKWNHRLHYDCGSEYYIRFFQVQHTFTTTVRYVQSLHITFICSTHNSVVWSSSSMNASFLS